jgi:succinylarginine dihydrolase
MRTNLALGLTQGILLPHPRPDHHWLAALSTNYASADETLRAQALSASPMWAANAATVSPAADAGDGRCHLTVANLLTMPHRSHEWPNTLAQLRLAFANPAFAVHDPVPAPFGDEGAANHMRLAARHGDPGVEVFVYGVGGGPFPARQHRAASEAIARRHRLDPGRTLFVAQSEAAIAAGAFHNDVVAVANEHVLFAHELAFADKEQFHRQLQALLPELQIIEVPVDEISLADAIASYLFNAQLVTLRDHGMALILPREAQAHQRVWNWLQRLVSGNGPIRNLEVVDVRESMANGGGPACLRLRVIADPTTIDPRFLVDDAKLDRIANVVERHWPDAIAASDIGNPALITAIEAAYRALITELDIVELLDS